MWQRVDLAWGELITGAIGGVLEHNPDGLDPVPPLGAVIAAFLALCAKLKPKIVMGHPAPRRRAALAREHAIRAKLSPTELPALETALATPQHSSRDVSTWGHKRPRTCLGRGAQQQLSMDQQQLQGAQHQLAQDQQQLQDAQHQLSLNQQELQGAQHQLAVDQQLLHDAQRQVALDQQQLQGAQHQLAVDQQQLQDAQHQLSLNQQELQGAQHQLAVDQQLLHDAQRLVALDQQQLKGAQQQLALDQQQLKGAQQQQAHALEQLQGAQQQQAQAFEQPAEQQDGVGAQRATVASAHGRMHEDMPTALLPPATPAPIAQRAARQKERRQACLPPQAASTRNGYGYGDQRSAGRDLRPGWGPDPADGVAPMWSETACACVRHMGSKPQQCMCHGASTLSSIPMFGRVTLASDKKEDAECLRLLHARAPHIASAHMTLNVHLLKEYARDTHDKQGPVAIGPTIAL
ncbi:hypothetical protein QJQ45_019673 [Haematococcus lacustris]|nr:hypothetical protein QJQ45_019673 [Haematococcus lacustris]